MLLRTLERTISAHQLAPVRGPWLVAVSGGADSLALLHALIQLQPRFGYALHVATFDHGVRVPDGADDARYVQDTAMSWGVPVTFGAADVPALAREQRLSIEAAARLARYQFLSDVARRVGAACVATAHNADDQAETVLMHILRGAGLAGLRGMAHAAPLPTAPDLLLTRPLLDVTREAVEAYCSEVGLSPRLDETNRDPVYLRNRLRLEMMPLLREINPRVARQLRQLAESSAVDANYIEETFANQLLPQARVKPGAVTLAADAFRATHEALQRRFVVWAARQLVPEVEVSYPQQLSAVDVALVGRVGAQATLPDGLRLRVDYEKVVIERAEYAAEPSGALLLPGTVLDIPIPGQTQAGDWMLVTYIENEAQMSERATLALPNGAVVRLRTRRAGDRFAPLGLKGHTQKLKQWFIDHKVPQRVRDQVPLLEVNGALAAIVWGERWPVSDAFAVRDQNAGIVRFFITNFT